jgi:hypothetical protein
MASLLTKALADRDVGAFVASRKVHSMKTFTVYFAYGDAETFTGHVEFDGPLLRITADGKTTTYASGAWTKVVQDAPDTRVRGF